jgi:hypothetical protein
MPLLYVCAEIRKLCRTGGVAIKTRLAECHGHKNYRFFLVGRKIALDVLFHRITYIG